MKTFNRICLICLILLTSSCSESDDDSSSAMQETTEDLLTSGKWYFQSKIPGSYSACEKRGYLQFMTNGSLILEAFDDSSGTCESLGSDTATYTMTNNTNLTIDFGSETQSAVIKLISDEELTLEVENETLVFDKTEG